MTFLDFARLVRRGLWFIIALTLLGAVLGFISSRLQPVMYETSATLLVTAAPTTSAADGQSANLLAQSRAQLLPQLALSDEVLTEAASTLGGGQHLADLRSRVTSTSVESTNFATVSASASSAQGAVDTVNAVVAALTDVGESLDVVTENGASTRTIRITEVSRPSPPDRAYSPQPRYSTAAGLAVGLALALIILTIREITSQRVRGANDVRALELGFPIAIIERATPLIARRSGAATQESYRYLRSTLLHGLGRRGLIAVTSVSARSSVEHLGRELARAIFEVGSSVLVVDARLDSRPTSDDDHRPLASASATRPASDGTGEGASADLAQQAVLPSNTDITVVRYEHLSDETATLAHRRGRQALADIGFAPQIKSLASEFDFTIVLLPSMADCAEAAVAAASTDAAVLQIDAGATRRGEVLLAHQRLRASGVRDVVGAIVGASRMDALPSTSAL